MLTVVAVRIPSLTKRSRKAVLLDLPEGGVNNSTAQDGGANHANEGDNKDNYAREIY